MRVSFIKMHGLGNDFVVLDGRGQPLPAMDAVLARALADRHTGIGCDQLIVIGASGRADVAMRIFNQDGSEVAACGNATRAVGLLLGKPASIETLAGILEAAPDAAGVAVEMGRPRFDWHAIPLAYAMDTLVMPVGWDGLESPTAVNVGNPHAVFFVPDCDAVALDALGPVIEHDPLFPERVNVNVATVVSRQHLRLRVWERGAGLTLACGTGACASAVAAMRRGLCDRAVTVSLPGGDLRIEWRGDDVIVMTGPATESFRGSFESADFIA
ncbi:MAG: diaminopimelate epimerase [Sphingomonadales bacterium]|nr:diaminopimelate epimerase [Sphingomonadales bacterium]